MNNFNQILNINNNFIFLVTFQNNSIFFIDEILEGNVDQTQLYTYATCSVHSDSSNANVGVTFNIHKDFEL